MVYNKQVAGAAAGVVETEVTAGGEEIGNDPLQADPLINFNSTQQRLV